MASHAHETYVPPASTHPLLSPLLNPNPNHTSSTTTDKEPTAHYRCGGCEVDIHLKKGDPIQCRDCGFRILMKERGKR